MANGNAAPGFVPMRPEDQAFVPARPEDQAFVPARPEDIQQSDPDWISQAINSIPGVGAVKSAARTVAGLADVLNRPLPIPGADPNAPLVPGISRATNWIRSATKPANFEQELEGLAETVGELLMPETLLGKGGEAAKVSDTLAQGGRIAKILEDYPTINAAVQAGRAAIKGGARGATEQGIQTFIRSGGDPTEALKAAAVGGGAGAVLSGGIQAARGAAELLRPTTEALEGVNVPIPASEANPSGLAAITGKPPAITEAQAAATPQILQNGARNAMKTALDEVNLTRGAMHGPAEEFPPASPFKFTVAPHGQDIETGDVGIVRKMLNDAQDLKNSTDFQNLSARQQTRIDGTIDSLQQQINDYTDYQASLKHFAPLDTNTLLQNVHNYQDAGAIMQDAVRGDLYKTLDPATTERIKTLAQAPESDTAAQQELADIFKANRAQISPGEWQSNVDVYRKGKALQDWGDAIAESMNKPLTRAQKLGAELTPLQQVLQSRGEDIKSMIGDDGIKTGQRLTQLMQSPQTAGRFQELIDSIGMYGRRYHAGVGGLIGSSAAWLFGLHTGALATAGLTGTYAARKVLQYVASNPAIADRVVYAVEHGVGPRLAAPLISSMIVRAANIGGQR